MKKLIVLLGVSLLAFCTSRSQNDIKETSYKIQENDDYELLIPERSHTGVLILFPGFPETPEVMKREFNVVEPATKAGIAVAFMKFNRRLWLTDDEKAQLATTINQLFEKNNLNQENVYIGGFSSGGNVSLLLSDYLVQSGYNVQPQGVFVIDSPVDLLGLYENSLRNIERDLSPVSVQESNMIVSLLEPEFGKPEDGIERYEQHSPYTLKTRNIENLSHLKDVRLRFYTEPDTAWWKENRQYEYEEMNAYFIKNLADDLRKKFGKNIDYIPTVNRGYRSNRNRHPHSWCIVDVDELIQWITNE